MNSLYIDRKGLHLKNQKDALLIYEEEQRKATIPLNLLERVIIANQVSVSASVLGKLGSLGIGVMVLSGYQQEVSLLMPAHSDGQRRLQQYHHCQHHGLEHAKALLHEKLQSQQIMLTEHHQCQLGYWQHAQQQIKQASSLAQLLGIEGHAAKHYFGCYAQLLPSQWRFKGRQKHPPKDPVNALLSLSYTLLYGESVRVLYAQGLDVNLGFYHQANQRRHALACDVMEPLRAQIDAWVLQQLREGAWSHADFSIEQHACLLKKEGRQRFYQLYEQAATHWYRQLNQSVKMWNQRFEIKESNKPAQWSEWEAICSKSPTV